MLSVIELQAPSPPHPSAQRSVYERKYQGKRPKSHHRGDKYRLSSPGTGLSTQQSPAMPQNTFIIYTHPSQRHDRGNRKRIASYIGTHYRNRSKPAARRALESRVEQTEQQIQARPVPIKAKKLRALKRCEPHTNIPRDAHGLRGDPFANYPGTSTSCVPRAVDYFIHFYAPTHVIRPDLIKAENSTLVIRHYFQYALSNPLLFDSIIALSQINLTFNRLANSDVHVRNHSTRIHDRDALIHYGQALKQLRELIEDSQKIEEDAVLFAIATLMGVDYSLNDLASFETHLDGLRRITALRGGIDALGWPTLLKPLLRGLEAIWAYVGLTTKSRKIQPKASVNVGNVAIGDHPPPIPRTAPPDPPLPYENPDKKWILPPESAINTVAGWNMTTEPAYYVPCPASPMGRSMMSYLPTGLQALCFGDSPRISLPVVTLLHRISTTDSLLSHHLPSTRLTRHGRLIRQESLNASNLQELEHWVRMLAEPGLSKLERATCVAMLNLLMDSSRSEQLSEVWLKQLQLECEPLLDAFDNAEEWEAMDQDEKNWFIWVVIDIAGSMVPPRSFNQRWPTHGGRGDKRLELAVRVVEEYGAKGKGWSWEQVQDMLMQFFWTDGCVLSWKNVWELACSYVEEDGHSR